MGSKRIINGITQNSIYLSPNTTFYAAGIRHLGYTEGVWLARFTSRLENARDFAWNEQHCRPDWLVKTSPPPDIRIWECKLAEGRILDSTNKETGVRTFYTTWVEGTDGGYGVALPNFDAAQKEAERVAQLPANVGKAVRVLQCLGTVTAKNTIWEPAMGDEVPF